MWCCNWTKNEVDTVVVREKVHGSSNEKSASDLGDGVLLGSSVGVVLGWLVGVLALFFVIEHITHPHTHTSSHTHTAAQSRKHGESLPLVFCTVLVVLPDTFSMPRLYELLCKGISRKP